MFCCVGMTFENAPVRVREAFAFPPQLRRELYARLVPHSGVLLVTCNRTELFATCPEERARALLQEIAGVRAPLVSCTGKEAERRLFLLAAGLRSMLLGEDEILHQLKDAYEQARLCGATDGLDALFQAALACGRKVRAETGISAFACSVATLAANAVMRFTGGHGKVLLVGGTGMVGGAVLKNLLAAGMDVCATERSHAFGAAAEGVRTVPYAERYAALNDADAVVSCTASPHVVFAAEEVAAALTNPRRRLFVDLAVPPDIEARVGALDGCILQNIDGFRAAAEANNAKKLVAAAQAEMLVSQCLLAYDAAQAARRHALLLRADPSLCAQRKSDPAAFLAALGADREEGV